MKTNNLNKLIKVALLSAALVTSVVACGNRNQDNQQLTAFQQSCVSGCEDISPIPFFTANSTAQLNAFGGYSSLTSLSLNISFAGQNINPQTNQNQNQNYNPWASPAMNYVGRVSAIGTVTAQRPLNLGFCPSIPAGQYSLATQNAGQWNRGQISGIRLVGSGSVSFTALLLNVQATEGWSYTGFNGSGRLYGTLQVEQVNGFYCQGANFQLY